MSGVFITPLGCTWVTNGMAHGLIGAWVALTHDLRSAAHVDPDLVSFLEKRLVLAESPGLGGFEVTEPPLDAAGTRRALALVNAELARRITAPDFDGGLIGTNWPALEQYWRCWWFEAAEAIHLGLWASLQQSPPALEWLLTPEQRVAVDVIHATQRLGTAPRPSEAEELAILRVVTEGVLNAEMIFRPVFRDAMERHFYRKAELEEAAGRPEEAANAWRVLGSILPGEAERDIANSIALEMNRNRRS